MGTRRGRPGGRNTPSHGCHDRSRSRASGTLKIEIAHQFVMCRCMMFGKIISTVRFAWGPIQVELFLGHPVFEPMVPHVECFRSFEANLGMKNAVSSGIVGFEWCTIGRLYVPHFLKGGTNRDSILCIEKEGADFGF